ncbi:class I SAM-dependent methyltransferase [Cloacibacillus sp. An23]|uniref:class I SAM-dependent methyltransferase n=1 Tax=Cloacibacillus sp. An23 TaxID=1965591 RepID=UPI000B37F88B|nr:class I SAM-dependent methyltransferase [Cloacibacillus sp. An23]OUO94139.1 SAM-dependent methyltransferase [Cloacibacillus sp. An23]
MDQQEYWNKAAETKQFTTPFQLEAFEKYVPRVASILDVGCGYGRTLDELYRAGWRDLIGIDFSEGMIQRGRDEYPYLDLRVKAEAERIDLPDESAGAVIVFAVLTCIRTDAEQERFIAEIRRVLRPGGILYVNDFLLNADERNAARYEKFKDKYGVYGVFELPEGAVCRHHDELWIKALLSGFKELEYSRLTFTTMNGHTSNGFYFIGRAEK